MAYSRETRDKLRRLYIYNQWSLEIVASQTGVAFSTAARWKKEAQDSGDDWDKMRAANLMAGGGMEDAGRAVLMSLVTQCQAATEAINTEANLSAEKRVELLASLADAFNKATAASKKILPETNRLAIAIEVVQALGEHINRKFPAQKLAFVEILESFSEVIEDDFG
ncbi:DNA-binding protein [Salmonella enterica subsp. salamae]|nr:DNA-binding protein [Salmonella enterica subsp. salamae]ECI4341048.1 DNA-binding protein [Salmonella enterica subsp. salamae]EDL3627754.1 DNA-binding protein [Salmonella enterica subsp. enterica serovar Newport]EGU8719306.1 DNA-binding protein [Salmonella enterica]